MTTTTTTTTTTNDDDDVRDCEEFDGIPPIPPRLSAPEKNPGPIWEKIISEATTPGTPRRKQWRMAVIIIITEMILFLSLSLSLSFFLFE